MDIFVVGPFLVNFLVLFRFKTATQGDLMKQKLEDCEVPINWEDCFFVSFFLLVSIHATVRNRANLNSHISIY